jgi:hypothetical protein
MIGRDVGADKVGIVAAIVMIVVGATAFGIGDGNEISHRSDCGDAAARLERRLPEIDQALGEAPREGEEWGMAVGERLRALGSSLQARATEVGDRAVASDIDRLGSALELVDGSDTEMATNAASQVTRHLAELKSDLKVLELRCRR